MTTVQDLVTILDGITRGRVVTALSDLTTDDNPFVVTKSSNIPGKAVTEIPGLVWGRPENEVKRLALCTTLTEVVLELAGALQVDAVLSHHPVADAASSGGVPLGGYCDLYGINVIELHEAYHGLHHGIPYLHGYEVLSGSTNYGGIPGNVLWVGRTLNGVKRLSDILARLSDFMACEADAALLEAEQVINKCEELVEAATANPPRILLGQPDTPVQTIIHIFPHTGFSPEHLEQAKTEYPEVDTLLCSISRVRASHPLVEKARTLGMSVVLGNTHALEILENWVPLAWALKSALPALEITVCRERVTAYPFDVIGGSRLQTYAEEISEQLLRR